ncbi:MAG TPA: MFS transporter [Gaiellaceae bacterium]|jgi:MFS family permease
MAEIFPALPHSVKQCDCLAIGTLRGHFSESAAALRGVFRSTGLRRIELAFLGSILGIYANVVAVSIYAFHHGGATAVGLVMFARMGAAAVSAPFLAGFADRHEQRRVMLATDLVRVGTLAAIAASAAAGVPALVYALAILTSIVSTAFRPAEASLVPRLAETPEELTAANVTSSTFDSIGAFAGPAAGALLYTAGGPTLAFLCVSLTYLWSASFVARIPKVEQPRPSPHAHEETGGIAAGFRAVRGEPRLRVVIGLYGAQTMVAGAYSVLVVVVALELLDLGNAGVGFLQAATGVGAIIGALLALALVGRKRTAANFGLGLACFGAPLLALAALPRTWAAVVALALLGIGNSVVDISAVTLIQRTASAAVAGRVFGLVEAAAVGGLGIGSVLTPLLLHLAGARWTLAVAGAILPVLSLVMRRALNSIDAGATVPEEQLDAIATVPFLEVLPIHRKEALAAALERVDLPAGATLFSAGDHGDRLYILSRGTIEIDLPSGPKVEDAPAFVGEIALLRDVPRTATVRVVSDSTFWTLDAEHFLEAVTGHSRSRTAADALVASRGIALSA